MPALRISVGLVVRPLTQSCRAMALMRSRSAPSANNLMLSLSRVTMSALCRRGASQDHNGCLAQGSTSCIRRGGQLFSGLRVAVIDQERETEGGAAERSDEGSDGK